jgi:hypothetical protein
MRRCEGGEVSGLPPFGSLSRLFYTSSIQCESGTARPPGARPKQCGDDRYPPNHLASPRASKNSQLRCRNVKMLPSGSLPCGLFSVVLGDAGIVDSCLTHADSGGRPATDRSSNGPFLICSLITVASDPRTPRFLYPDTPACAMPLTAATAAAQPLFTFFHTASSLPKSPYLIMVLIVEIDAFPPVNERTDEERTSK